MKKLSIVFALIALIVFSGCTKKYYGTDITDNPPFLVEGIQDITMNANSPQRNFYLAVSYNHGEQEKVKIYFEGLPAGLSALFSSGSFGSQITSTTFSGIPTFQTYVNFYDSSAAPGVYEVNLVAVGAISGKKTLPFTITITAVPDCAVALAGNYYTSNFCATGPSGFTSAIRTDASVARKIYIDNFENSGVTLYATVNCTSESITIPSQVVNGNTYSGYGYFYYGSTGTISDVQLSYTKIFSSGGSTSCNSYMNK